MDSGWRSLMPLKMIPFSSQSNFPTDAATKQQHSFLTNRFGGVQDQPVIVKIEQQPLREGEVLLNPPWQVGLEMSQRGW